MPVSRLNLRAVVSSRREAAQFIVSPNDAVLIDRGGPRWLVLSCPCGCGEQFPINLDPRAGPAWRLYKSNETLLSVFPSVWRDTGCRSHYIIWRGAVHLFGKAGPGDEPAPDINLASLHGSVRNQLSRTSWRHFANIASDLNAIPWDVLEVCRWLVRRNEAIEGSGNLQGNFRLHGSKTLVDRSA